MRALALALSLVATQAGAKVPVVVSDIAPVHSLAASVMGDLGQPQLLLDPSADPHSLQLRPSQAQALADADLVIWMGSALTPWLTDTLATLAPEAGSMALLDLPEPPLRIGGGEDEAPLDPHAWLDPASASFYLGNIALELGRLDPPNAEIYAANASAAIQNLMDLHKALVIRLEPLKKVTLVGSHDDLAYFLKRYDLQVIGALSDSAGTAPGAARLSALRADIAKAADPVCVLLEPKANPNLITSLGPDRSMRVVRIDPLGSNLELGPELFATMIRDLSDQLASCAAP